MVHSIGYMKKNSIAVMVSAGVRTAAQLPIWQINDSSTRDYYMLNTTDSVYSRVIPVEYPVAGQMPSPFKIGVVQIAMITRPDGCEFPLIQKMDLSAPNGMGSQ